MDDIAELKAAREKVAELEKKMQDEVQAKLALLGNAPAPKAKRTRRTRAQIQADNARAEAAE